MNKTIRLVSIVGPTASGKTKLSVEIAKRFDGEVISADSMQIYKGMQIATAKPTAEEMQGIRHHLIDFLPTDSTYSVANFCEDASRCIDEVSARGKLPIIAGGTGLYVDSLLNNISFREENRDERLTEQLYKYYEENGVDALLSMLSEFDPQSAQRLSEQRNIKRIIRAIEFYKTTGITMTEQNEKSRLVESPYKPVKIGLNYNDRQKLYDRINLRVDIMLENGLLQEAEQVLNSSLSYTSVKAIGYKELAPYFKGERALDECIENLKRETRRYAKRQLTWFRRDTDINWIYADEYSSFDDILNQAASIIERGLLSG